MSRDACFSCHAPVIWAKTEKGRAMPVDAAPVETGNIELAGGVAKYVPAGTGRYVSHFVTCPQAKGWRKR